MKKCFSLFNPRRIKSSIFEDFLKKHGFVGDLYYPIIILDIDKKQIMVDNNGGYVLNILENYYSDIPNYDGDFGSIDRYDRIREKHDQDKGYKQQLIFRVPEDIDLLMAEILKMIDYKREKFVFEKFNIIGI